jgi:hypothetical protein
MTRSVKNKMAHPTKAIGTILAVKTKLNVPIHPNFGSHCPRKNRLKAKYKLAGTTAPAKNKVMCLSMVYFIKPVRTAVKGCWDYGIAHFISFEIH